MDMFIQNWQRTKKMASRELTEKNAQSVNFATLKEINTCTLPHLKQKKMILFVFETVIHLKKTHLFVTLM